MKIATFNINGIRARIGPLTDWLSEARPDVAVLQEIKTVDDGFPAAHFEDMGYRVETHGQKSFNGVAILSRLPLSDVTRGLPGDDGDDQARFIAATVEGPRPVRILGLYLPNGNPAPGPKFDYKLAWLGRMRAHGRELLAAGVPAVLAGDWNVVPEPRDIYPTRSYDDNALVQPAPRAIYARILADGWTDALRHLHPEATLYSFWDYRRNRWPRDAGMRLDHLLLSPAALPRLAAAGIDREMRGREDASDHAPTWIELGD